MKKITPLIILLISNVFASGCTTSNEIRDPLEDHNTFSNYRFQPDVPFLPSNINKSRNDQTEKK